MKFLLDKQFIAALIVAIFVWMIMNLIGIHAPQNVNPWMVILLYPVLEEIVFRGLIQESIAQKINKTIWKISYANIITSIIFVALHFIYQPPLWALLVLIPSLIFGYFRDRYNSIIPAIVLHIFYNFGYFYF